MSSEDRLAVGEIDLGYDDLAAAAPEHQVPDLSAVLPGRRGTAVRFGALIERAAPADEARFVHVASEDGGFTASLERDQLAEHGLVLYALDGEPLPREFGGPFRLFVADSEDCSVNVKFLGSVAFASEPGSHTAACADE